VWKTLTWCQVIPHPLCACKIWRIPPISRQPYSGVITSDAHLASTSSVVRGRQGRTSPTSRRARSARAGSAGPDAITLGAGPAGVVLSKTTLGTGEENACTRKQCEDINRVRHVSFDPYKKGNVRGAIIARVAARGGATIPGLGSQASTGTCRCTFCRGRGGRGCRLTGPLPLCCSAAGLRQYLCPFTQLHCETIHLP
jgi:hypothetical protein